MELQKIDENKVYNLFSIGKANREINALPISHAVHPHSMGWESISVHKDQLQEQCRANNR